VSTYVRGEFCLTRVCLKPPFLVTMCLFMHRDIVILLVQYPSCCGSMLATINQMSDSGRPTTPLRVPGEESGVRERFTRSMVLQSSEEEIPIIKSEPRKGKSEKGPTNRGSPFSVEPKARRRLTPKVEYAGYKGMISRLQEDATDAIRTRTRDLIERRQSIQIASPHVEDNISSVEDDISPAQRQQYSSQDEQPFYSGYNSTMKEPKRKYYAVRRGRIPGIYRTWDSCEKQVEGFSGCEFKSFNTEEGALQYLVAVKTHQKFEDTNDQLRESALPTSREVYDGTYAQCPFRNDAVYPIPGTALRRNVTQRRSQGRTKDRVSLGETSVPLETLLARKPQPRDIDVEYQTEALLFTPPQLSTAMPDDAIDCQDGNLPRVRPTKAQDLWNQKSKIEEDMYSALVENDEGTYRALEVKQQEINSQICLILAPTLPSSFSSFSNGTTGDDNRMGHYHNESFESPSMYNGDDNQSTAADWHYTGSSYVIYLATRETTVPWTVWATMPVSLLVQAAVTLLSRSRILVTAETVLLVHEGIIMDADGLLSDYPVLIDDVVTVTVTVPRGGSVSDRKVPTGPTDSRNRPMHTSKPRPTMDPNMESRHGRAGTRGRDGMPNGNKSVERRGTSNRLEDNYDDKPVERNYDDKEEGGRDSRSYDKIKQTFKCPKFSGQTKDWKQWNKGFQRYLSIWDLGHVLHPDFFEELPLSKLKMKDNKFVYYILEDATQSSALASSYVRQAPIENGFEAYYTLHDGFVFAGATASTILINELSNFRFKQSETPTELIMRLEELFQDLEMLPNEAALVFNDTQKIGYLLGALRHESQWATVASTITSEQLKGKTTFRQACEELKVRCEADKAYSLIDKQIHNKKKVHGLKAKVVVDDVQEESTDVGGGLNDEVKALISSMSKRLNQVDEIGTTKTPRNKKGKRVYEQRKCIAKGCTGQSTFLLCGLHYHSMVSGKNPTVELENGWGNATFSTTTNSVVYPPGVPSDLLPKPKKSQ
jgi:hypothetical protein